MGLDFRIIGRSILDAYLMKFQEQQMLRQMAQQQEAGRQEYLWRRQQELQDPEYMRQKAEHEAALRREAADRNVTGYLALAGGDPQRAFAIGGQEFLSAWQESGRGTIGTRQIDVTKPLTLGGYGAPSEAIRGQAGRTIPIATGERRAELNLPAPPAPPAKRVVVMDNSGKVVSAFEVPQGTEVRTVTPTKPQEPQRFIIVDSKGRTVKTITAPPGTQLRVLPEGGGGMGGVVLPPAIPGGNVTWVTVPPATKGGESRYYNTRTQQVFTRSGALAALPTIADRDSQRSLAQALGVADPGAPKPRRTRAQVEAEVQKIKRRMEQIESFEGEDVPPSMADKLQQEFAELEDRLEALQKLLVIPTGTGPGLGR